MMILMQYRRITRFCSVIILSALIINVTLPFSRVNGIQVLQITTKYTLQFSSGNAWSFLETMMSYNPRSPGTVGINETAAYIESALIDNGGTVIEENFTVKGVHCKNIIGEWKPANDDGEIVMLGSHYDARAKATQDPDTSKRNDTIPAADDGGSSTVILMELARILNNIYKDPELDIRRETWLAFFDAEDQGNDGNGEGISGWDWCEGSSTMAAHLNSFTGSASHVVMFTLLDMVGGIGLQVNHEMFSNQSLLSSFFAMGQCLGYGQYFSSSAKSYYIEDDHQPFININIPSIDIIDITYPQWHTTSDNLAYVSASVIGSIGRVSEGFLLSNLLNRSSLSITDPDTGYTWTATKCSFNNSWFAFTGFLGQYWPYLVLGGLVIIIASIFLLKRLRQRQNGTTRNKLARKSNSEPSNMKRD